MPALVCESCGGRPLSYLHYYTSILQNSARLWTNIEVECHVIYTENEWKKIYKISQLFKLQSPHPILMLYFSGDCDSFAVEKKETPHCQKRFLMIIIRLLMMKRLPFCIFVLVSLPFSLFCIVVVFADHRGWRRMFRWRVSPESSQLSSFGLARGRAD